MKSRYSNLLRDNIHRRPHRSLERLYDSPCSLYGFTPLADTKFHMPEMPEVEILARHLRPLLRGKTIRAVSVRRERATRPPPPREFERALTGSKFKDLKRRGKYMLFEFEPDTRGGR